MYVKYTGIIQPKRSGILTPIACSSDLGISHQAQWMNVKTRTDSFQYLSCFWSEHLQIVGNCKCTHMGIKLKTAQCHSCCMWTVSQIRLLTTCGWSDSAFVFKHHADIFDICCNIAIDNSCSGFDWL